MGFIPEEVIDEVEQRNDIVEVVSGYVSLRRSGANFKALCPFHREKTGSFMVSPGKQIWHCFGCFPSGSLIKTEMGFHKIEDVQVGELVLTHRGRLMPVVRTLWRPYNGKIIEIYTRKSNLPVTLTADHEVFVIKTKNCQYKSRRTRICQRRCKLNCTEKFFNKYKIEKLSAKQLSINDYLLYPINQEIDDVKFVDLNKYYNRKESNFGPEIYPIPTNIRVDDKFLKLIGYWIAEGSNHRAYIRFSLGAHEKKFAEEIKELIKTIFHIKTSIHIRNRPDNTGLEITACNSKLSNIFENLCGKGAENKHIPFEFQKLPPKKQEVILNAIFKGDGYTGKVAKCKENRKFKALRTTSLVLAEQLRDILLRLGISPTFRSYDARVDKKKTRHKTSYSVLWQHNIKLHFSDIIQANNVLYQIFPIRKIVKKGFMGDVYNLTVAKDHSYATPNFVVGNCGLGGNVVNFVMKYENLEFPEAVRMLAKKVGVEIPETRRTSTEGQSKLKKLYEVNELAAKYFSRNLIDQANGKLARDYLKKRGLKDDVSSRSRLGYAPERWDGFLLHAKGLGISEETLKAAGLILSSKEGRHYDRFRNKLIFPIFDLQGRVLGFGGRVLDGSLPKYVNSPETQIFRKGRNLYGLNWAKNEMRFQDYIIVVEGYMDQLMLYQNGFRNVVASLGTALTGEQLRLVKRFAETICMVYDADQAGEAASLRALDLALEEGLRVKVVTLPEGSDPDDYLRQKGPESFKKQLDSASDLFDYKLGLLTRGADTTKVEDVAKIVAEMLPTIAKVSNAVLRSGYIKELSKRLLVEESALITELKKVKEKGSSYYIPKPRRPAKAMSSEERTLIKLMLEDIEVSRRVKDSLDLEDFKDPRAKRIVGVLFKLIRDTKSFNPSRLMSRFEDDELNQLISGLLVGTDEFQDRTKVVCDCIRRMKDLNLKNRRLALTRDIRSAEASGDDSQRMKLLAEFQALLGGSKKKI